MAEARASYVETRAKWERLYETTQTKGTGEAHPNLSPHDEFADFEIGDKGNLDGSVLHEKVYDVAWSGDRKPDANGKVPAVGNPVDVAKPTRTNSIGEPELTAVWKDADFDPKQRHSTMGA